MKRMILLVVFFLFTIFSTSVFAVDNDYYLKGFIQSMLKERYQLNTTIEVVDSEVFLPDTVAEHPEYEKIISDISSITDVKAIKLVDTSQVKRINNAWGFSGDTLFKPLIADPRWPKFSVSYAYFSKGVDYKHTMDVAMGKQFPVYRFGIGGDIYTEIGFFAGAFVKFDLSTNKDIMDIINSDYIFGIPVSMQFNDVITGIVRIYHQSSAVGTDYLARKGNIEYKKFRYDAVDMLVSYQYEELLRLYAGIGLIINSKPNIDKFMYHAGLELNLASRLSQMPPIVLALDVKGFAETDCTPSASFKAGMEIFKSTVLAFELYDGYSPDGQFFKKKTTSVGMGLTFLY